MTLDQWIATASSLGTLLAAVIAAMSILEIRRQVRTQFKPQIVVQGEIFEVSLINTHGWWWQPPAETGVKLLGTTDHRLPVLNVGNGTAVDVRFEWNFPISSMIDALNKLAVQVERKVEAKLQDDWVNFFEDGKVISGARPPGGCDEHRTYVLPVSQAKIDTKISPPLAVTSLILAFYTILTEAEAALNDEYTTDVYLPGMGTLEVRYADTMGRSYKQVFNARFYRTARDWEGGYMTVVLNMEPQGGGDA